MYNTIRFVAILLITIPAMGQKPRLSPLSVAAGRYQDSYVKVMYGKPSKKEREIFGKLVPFGKIWRTGANEATEITTTQDLKVNGSLLKKGTYSVLTIPYQNKWTVIFNAEVGMWGGYDYNEKKDVLRFDVPVQPIDKTRETFTIDIVEKEDNMADMVMMWDKTKISFPIEYKKATTKP